ncbi:hypothetical protein LOTGIDRAFT_234205 [Lottia gigantea]|uniref:Gamma-glutamylcyclotransferase n=1 Tax=Lottia gigantea TaxID=225164 RepID=V3ZEL1_LOTGI|nr:hypothetical protein LOTGIDRAFT_234205 [Lottia gigantea]ESO89583.1 hypothetical protein LOTGIDRAFT_234205 [Lottia gigantea]
MEWNQDSKNVWNRRHSEGQSNRINKNVEILKSRGRPIKMYETEPFLSVDLLPVNKICISPTPTLAADKPKMSLGMLKSQTFHSTTSSKSLPVDNITKSKNISKRSSLSSARSGRSNQTSVSGIERSNSNLHIKQPFKHSVVNTPNNTPTDELSNPSRLMKARTKLATSHMNKVLLKQRQKDDVRTKGKLLKGKLKPLYPVKNDGPTMEHCRGVVSDVTSHDPSPSRTLQRRRRIVSNYNNGTLHKLMDRPLTVESIHQTSEVSSVDGTIDFNQHNSLNSSVDEDIETQIQTNNVLLDTDASPTDKSSDIVKLATANDLNVRENSDEVDNKKDTVLEQKIQEKNGAGSLYIDNANTQFGHDTVGDGGVNGVDTRADDINSAFGGDNSTGLVSNSDLKIKNDSNSRPKSTHISKSDISQKHGHVSAPAVLKKPGSPEDKAKKALTESGHTSKTFSSQNSVEASHPKIKSQRAFSDLRTVSPKQTKKATPSPKRHSKELSFEFKTQMQRRPLSAVTQRESVQVEPKKERPKSASSLKTEKSGHPKSVRFADELTQDFPISNNWMNDVSPRHHVTVNIYYREPEVAPVSEPTSANKRSVFETEDREDDDDDDDEDEEVKLQSKSSCKPNDESKNPESEDDADGKEDKENWKPKQSEKLSSTNSKSSPEAFTQGESSSVQESDIKPQNDPEASSNGQKELKDVEFSRDEKKGQNKSETCSVDDSKDSKTSQIVKQKGSTEDSRDVLPTDLDTSFTNASASDVDSLQYDGDVSTISLESENTEISQNSDRSKSSLGFLQEIMETPPENFDSKVLDVVMNANSPQVSEDDPFYLSIEEAEFIEEICDLTNMDSPVYMVDPEFNKNMPKVKRNSGRKIYDRFQHKHVRMSRRPQSAGNLRRPPTRQLPVRPSSAGPDYRKKLFGVYCAMCKHQQKFCRCKLQKHSIFFENLYRASSESSIPSSIPSIELLPEKSILKTPSSETDKKDSQDDEESLDLDRISIHEGEESNSEDLDSFIGGESFEALEEQLQNIKKELQREIGIEEDKIKKVEFLDDIEEFSDTGFSETDPDEQFVPDYEIMLDFYRQKCLDQGNVCLQLSKHIMSKNKQVLLTDVVTSPIQCLNGIYNSKSSLHKSLKYSTQITEPVLKQELNNLASGCFLQYVCDFLPEVGKEAKSAEDKGCRSRRESDSSSGIGLEIVATRKEIFSPTGQSLDEDKAVPFAPLCFTINARPPAGYLYYFAYGTDLNHERLGMYIRRKIEIKRWGVLFGFNMLFNKKGVDEEDGIGFPNIEFNPFSSVEGCVYELSNSELHLLDSCVGFPEHYEHIVVPVWMTGGSSLIEEDKGDERLDDCVAQYCVPALTYIAHDQWVDSEKMLPCDFSLSQCLKGSDVLSPSYIQYLNRIAESTQI